MESTKFMDLHFIPTLLHLTLFQVALIMYNTDSSPLGPLETLNASILSPIANYENVSDNFFVHAKFNERMNALKLSRCICKKLWVYIRSIHIQVQSSVSHYVKIFGPQVSSSLLKNIVWTGRGAIDFQKTAEVLLKEEFLPIQVRFSLASEYCMDRYISLLWQQGLDSITLLKVILNKPLVKYWVLHEKGNIDSLIELQDWRREPALSNTFQCAFLVAMRCYNKTAMCYFYPKVVAAIGKSLAEEFFINCTEDLLRSKKFGLRIIGHRFSDAVCFLLSTMMKNKQEYFLKNYIDVVFFCFLAWPYNAYFSDLIDFLSQNSIFPRDIRVFFDNWWFFNSSLISGNFYCSKQDYQEMFAQYWRTLPQELQRSVQIPDEARMYFMNSDI